jgi:hypothetical protein
MVFKLGFKDDFSSQVYRRFVGASPSELVIVTYFSNWRRGLDVSSPVKLSFDVSIFVYGIGGHARFEKGWSNRRFVEFDCEEDALKFISGFSAEDAGKAFFLASLNGEHNGRG